MSNRNRDNLLVGKPRKRVQEIIADNLSKADWSLGWVSAMDREGRTLWIADAHRDDAARIPLNFHMSGNQDEDKP